MAFTFAQIATWLVIGLIGGSLAALVVRGERRGFGGVTNLALGCAGAIVGGALFRWLRIFPELDSISISFRAPVSEIICSLLVPAALLFLRAR